MPRIVATLVCLSTALAAAGLQEPARLPQVLKSRISMVPVDVRVVDRQGHPVADLRQEDFTLLEDGIEQEIRHFALQALVPETGGVPGRVDLELPAGDVRAQNRRVFLFVLGRGRMTGPSKELEALLAFIRERLLPQDVVALVAYNRATDFTTDHEAIARIIERYRERHERIEAGLFHWFNDLQATHGARTLPAAIQAQVEDLFAGASELRPREVVPGQLSDRERIARDVQRATDELQRSELLAGREAGLADPANSRASALLAVTLREHIQQSVVTNHDVANIYAGIEYMRFIDGEKHLVLITPVGLDLPRLENERSIAAAAADSRVAIDIVYTGGLAGAPPPGAHGSAPLPSFATTSRQLFNVEGMRLMSELTGGHTTAYRYGAHAMNRLDLSTRAQYVLGYYPTNPRFDGGYRRLTVKVKRKNVELYYRRGYFAYDRVVALDKREFMTFTRIAAAARFGDDELRDLRVRMKSPSVKGSGRDRGLTLEVTIAPDRIAFTEELGLKVAALTIAFFAGTKDGQSVGESWQNVDLRLTPHAYARFLQEGFTFTTTIPLRNYPKQAKAVLYNYTSDLLGTSTIMVY
ncbi:MAG TPA: VWA domain-containing protein [Vicinamibacterales bacterium]|nr:VWA domain-containing protein [Vicinamibacterales bacterium]